MQTDGPTLAPEGYALPLEEQSVAYAMEAEHTNITEKTINRFFICKLHLLCIGRFLGGSILLDLFHQRRINLCGSAWSGGSAQDDVYNAAGPSRMGRKVHVQPDGVKQMLCPLLM
jgi:hypothetical protein